MKILVTAANGQVGWELARQGATSAHEVIALDRQALDITSAEAISAIFNQHKPDLLINAAAYTAVDKAETDQDMAFAINREGPKLLAEACRLADIPMLHISTDYVFDGSQSGPYEESDPVAPLGVYGMSKWQGEEAVRHTLDKYIILRTAWVFGSHGNNFVKTMLRVGADRDELRVVDDQFGGPTSAAGIAAALLHIADQVGAYADVAWGTYHYSGQPFVNWHGFAVEIFRQARQLGIIQHDINVQAIPSSEYPTPAARPANSRLSSDGLEKAFSIKADDWQLALQQMLAGMVS